MRKPYLKVPPFTSRATAARLTVSSLHPASGIIGRCHAQVLAREELEVRRFLLRAMLEIMHK